MNLIKICLFSLLAAVLVSCNDDFKDFDSKAFLTADTEKTTYLIQDNVAEYSASLSVGIPKRATRDLVFKFAVDASLVDHYNKAFNDKAVILPSEYYTLDVTEITIPEGNVNSAEIPVEFHDVNQLDRNIVYVLPVSIVSAEGIGILETARTHYYIFKGGALINWAADIEKNYFPVNWVNPQDIQALTNLTIEGLLYLRMAEREGSDDHIMTFFGVESGFLIRLGDTFEPGQVMVYKAGSHKYPDNANDRTKVPVGQWFHLAVTYDASNTIRIYVDGELKSSTVSKSTTPVNFAGSCYIGYSWNDNRWWPGMICETRVWNVVRTQQEIRDNMYSVDPATPGLQAYWKFDESNGNVVKDYSGNGNDITANSDLKWSSISLPEE